MAAPESLLFPRDTLEARRESGQLVRHVAARQPKVWLRFRVEALRPKRADQSDLAAREVHATFITEPVVIVLRADVTPRLSENFRALCTGEDIEKEGHTTSTFHFKGCPVHRIAPSLGFLHTGDTEYGDGSGGEAVPRGLPSRAGVGLMDEEEDRFGHIGRGVVSLGGVDGPDTIGSCFFITFRPCPLLDGHAVPVGFVATGWEVLSQLEALGTPAGFCRPDVRVWIHDCGQVEGDGTAQASTLVSRGQRPLMPEAEEAVVEAEASGRFVSRSADPAARRLLRSGHLRMGDALPVEAEEEAAARAGEKAAAAIAPAAPAPATDGVDGEQGNDKAAAFTRGRQAPAR